MGAQDEVAISYFSACRSDGNGAYRRSTYCGPGLSGGSYMELHRHANLARQLSEWRLSNSGIRNQLVRKHFGVRSRRW